SREKEFIICTEEGVSCRLMGDNPHKKFFFPEPCPCCVDMKLNSLKTVLDVLQNEENEIIIDEKTRSRAMLPLDKMLELAR
ncbi:MAG: quinolinate synthase NadA, partial [Clostridia bacterium]|nr:quinolinate synthase NadA [Clostridia bacterium]